MDHSIASVIHYCTNEYRFIKKLVEEVKKFSSLIVIPVCDHFFNGEKENRALLDRTYQDFPECRFIEFAFHPRRLYNRFLTGFTPKDPEWGLLWHSTSRYLAAFFMPPEIEYILFIDGDEVIDGDRFSKWLDQNTYRSFSALRFLCYIYACRSSFRTSKVFPSALMVRQKMLDLSQMIQPDDRHGIFASFPPAKMNALADDHGDPFIHHYSWVRTQEECIRKSETWGHRLDWDWRTIIDDLFENPNDPKMLDLNCSFVEAEPFFDPLAVPVPQCKAVLHSPANVLKVDERMIFRQEIMRMAHATD